MAGHSEATSQNNTEAVSQSEPNCEIYDIETVKPASHAINRHRTVNKNTPAFSKQRKQPKPIPDEFQPIIPKVIAKMNELAGTAYQPGSKIVLDGLLRRLEAGATELDCLTVVEDRWREWGTNPDMRKHFNPETLFRESNFEKYLNGARMASNGRSTRGFVG